MITRSLTHWGLYEFESQDGKLLQVTPVAEDLDPSPIGQNLIEGNRQRRVARPAIRKGYLQGDQGKNRGEDSYIEVSWQEAIEQVASALEQVRRRFGNDAIYGGSYGWASAGRFHHAQSQLHRFLNCIGGYTASANAYSFAAAEVILPKVIGQHEDLLKAPSSWSTIQANSQLMVCFGGLPLRNAQITNGGMSQHIQRDAMAAAKNAGIEFINIGPSADDVAPMLRALWLPIRPGTDTAMMLGIAYHLYVNELHDQQFLQRYCTGFPEFTRYLTGASDGVKKTPDWAADITGIQPSDIVSLAEKMAAKRTMMSLSWSLSRHEHGEQPYWMGITLAAMLGQIGLPGGGIGLGYSVENKVGKNVRSRYLGHLPQFSNPSGSYIPVARIADMLLNPGKSYQYNGETRQYPDIKLIYWAGGNPFHHHQDLHRLRAAFKQPETVICHELVWNATAQHADIVLPVASFLERNDIGGAPNEDILVAMKQVLPPFEASRTDFEIFTAIAGQLGCKETFTESRDERAWLQVIYAATRNANKGMPDFESFWQQGEFKFPAPSPHTLFEGFRTGPEKSPLATPSGKIMITRDDIGHARWLEPSEWLANAAPDQFQLISHQPESRLHSQLYLGDYSQKTKINGAEPIQINPDDARRMQLKDGNRVKVYNDRGALLAAAVFNPNQMPGVLHIATGAWWAPDDQGTCINGNPNAVTQDIGTSEIAQGPAALTCLVRIEKAD